MNLPIKISKVIKESNSEDDFKYNIKALLNSSKFSNSMGEMIESFMNSRTSLEITQDESGRANILGVPIQISEADTIEINENIYDLIPETYKSLSSTSYTGKTKKNQDDVLTMYKIIRDLGYTGRRDRQSTRKTFSTLTVPRLVNDIQNKTFDEITDDSDDLQGEGIKNFIPSNILEIYTKLEILLELRLSGHTDTITEASNLMDELYNRGEVQNQQQHRNAPNKFSTL